MINVTCNTVRGVSVQNFRKRLQACVFKAGGHFEHSM